MKFISLTNGGRAIVDDADYPALSMHKWRRADSSAGHLSYVARTLPDHKTVVLMHREIMRAEKGVAVDHKSGDGLDNRRSNLRTCTHTQNLRNQQSRRGTSRFKGVMWNKRKGCWNTQICVAGRKIGRKHFKVEEDAARFYDSMATKYFGAFARLNFPQIA